MLARVRNGQIPKCRLKESAIGVSGLRLLLACSPIQALRKPH